MIRVLAAVWLHPRELSDVSNWVGQLASRTHPIHPALQPASLTSRVTHRSNTLHARSAVPNSRS